MSDETDETPAIIRLDDFLKRMGLVGTGGEAIALIAQSIPDLVIVDTTLPDVDGIEWIARVRSEYTVEQLPILVFSLDPSLETVERAFHAGAQDYLITPFDPTVLEDKIEALLAARVKVAGRR